jgi:hypothetical protein
VPGTEFGNAADTMTALAAFQSLSGSAGTTNYGAAFAQLTNLINADGPGANGENYVVVFMSDGQPKDQGNAGTEQLNNVSSLVTQLVSLLPGQITVSTVYFGSPSDSQSEANLQAMATAGSGQFVDTNATTQFSIDNLITVPVTACSTP